MQHPIYFINIVKATISLLMICYLYGCGLVIRPKVAFVVKNESDYNVDISFYGKGVLLRGISLPQGDQFDTTLVEALDSQTLSPFPREADSIAISFDKQKVIVQSCEGEKLYYNYVKCQFKKNLMDFGNGEVENNRFYPKTTQTITFDNSDYERAVAL